MKHAKIIFISAALLITTAARADLSGDWQGTGTYSNSYGPETAHCFLITFDVNHTDTQFTIEASKIDCDGVALQANPSTMNITDGQLLLGGRKIGTITDKQFVIDEVDTTHWSSLHLAGTVKADGTMDYDLKLTNHDNWAEVTGTLAKH